MFPFILKVFWSESAKEAIVYREELDWTITINGAFFSYNIDASNYSSVKVFMSICPNLLDALPLFLNIWCIVYTILIRFFFFLGPHTVPSLRLRSRQRLVGTLTSVAPLLSLSLTTLTTQPATTTRSTTVTTPVATTPVSTTTLADTSPTTLANTSKCVQSNICIIPNYIFKYYL